MVDIYSSWCEEIHLNQEAINLIKSSKFIQGVELVNIDDQFKILNGQINTSLHNPIRFTQISTSDNQFTHKLTELNIIQLMEDSTSKVVGFHIDDSTPDKFTKSFENLEELSKISSKQILIEFSPRYCEQDIFVPNIPVEKTKGIKSFLFQDHQFNQISPSNLKSLFQNSDLKLLLDISHMIITVNSAIRHKLYSKTIIDYFEELIREVGPYIHQIHLNSPTFYKNSIVDTHKPIDSQSGSLPLMLLKKIFPKLTNLKQITLEIDTAFNPVNHIKFLIEQAKILDDILKQPTLTN